jgi:hypothetical protein
MQLAKLCLQGSLPSPFLCYSSMVLFLSSVWHLSSVFGYIMLPVAARFIPITLNTSMPVHGSLRPENNTTNTRPMKFETIINTLILASSAVFSLSTASAAPTMSELSPPMPSLLTSTDLMSSTGPL